MDWVGGVTRQILPCAQMANPGDFPPARKIGMHCLGFKRGRLKNGFGDRGLPAMGCAESFPGCAGEISPGQAKKDLMDSGGAGGIFSHAQFVPPFVPPTRCRRNEVHRRAANVPMRGYDGFGKAGAGDEQRIKPGFQTLGAPECDFSMRNHTRRFLS